jgi:hypothetical protein
MPPKVSVYVRLSDTDSVSQRAAVLYHHLSHTVPTWFRSGQARQRQMAAACDGKVATQPSGSGFTPAVRRPPPFLQYMILYDKLSPHQWWRRFLRPSPRRLSFFYSDLLQYEDRPLSIYIYINLTAPEPQQRERTRYRSHDRHDRRRDGVHADHHHHDSLLLLPDMKCNMATIRTSREL